MTWEQYYENEIASLTATIVKTDKYITLGYKYHLDFRSKKAMEAFKRNGYEYVTAGNAWFRIIAWGDESQMKELKSLKLHGNKRIFLRLKSQTHVFLDKEKDLKNLIQEELNKVKPSKTTLERLELKLNELYERVI